jgi:hypothetical protein
MLKVKSPMRPVESINREQKRIDQTYDEDAVINWLFTADAKTVGLSCERLMQFSVRYLF